MRLTQLGPDRRQEWNTFAAQQPTFSLLQSCEWGDFKEKLGWKVFRIGLEGDDGLVAGAQLLIKSLRGGVASMAYVPRGPIGGWQNEDAMRLLLSGIHEVARANRAIFVKVEPPVRESPEAARALVRIGFRPSPQTNQPRTTIILDLSPALDEILGEARPKTRQYVGKSYREGITVRAGGPQDLPVFQTLMCETARREGFSARLPAYYEEEFHALVPTGRMVLLMAFRGEELLAVRTICCFGKHAAEFHAGTHRGVHLHPNYLLVWEGVKWAKTQGCITYDMWGIPDEIGESSPPGDEPPPSDRTDGLWGVYRFKRGFSRSIVRYLGAFDYVYSSPLYALATNPFLGVDRATALMDYVGRSRLLTANAK